MQFEKKQDWILPRETNSFASGAVATFDVSRELPIESMFLKATWSVSAMTSICTATSMRRCVVCFR